MYRLFYEHAGLESHKQIAVPDRVMLEIIRSLHSSFVRGHPGSKKMLHDLAGKTQQITDSCET